MATNISEIVRTARQAANFVAVATGVGERLSDLDKEAIRVAKQHLDNALKNEEYMASRHG